MRKLPLAVTAVASVIADCASAPAEPPAALTAKQHVARATTVAGSDLKPLLYQVDRVLGY